MRLLLLQSRCIHGISNVQTEMKSISKLPVPPLCVSFLVEPLISTTKRVESLVFA